MPVDAVNERLNGLVTLLQAVGIDATDMGDVKGLANGGGGGGGGGGIGDARQLNDEQIEAIIRKLQMAQAEAPQIIAALEAHAEARSVNNQQQQQQHHQQQQQEEEEEEEDDEFDEDANYPMVGHGVSDDISVVSDLTTPTVVQNVPVPEEELYKETLPPMMVGGAGDLPPMMINQPKRKNLVSQVRPGMGAGGAGAAGMVVGGGAGGPGVRRGNMQPLRPPGGAAAARRKNYQDTMAKLHENPHGMAYAGPSTAGPSGSTKKSQSSTKSSNVNGASPAKATTTKSKSKKSKQPSSSPQQTTTKGNSFESGGGGGGGDGWEAFDSKKSTSIDNDGFLVGGSFDPFNTGGQTSAAGELSSFSAQRDPFGDFEAASAGGTRKATKSSSKKSSSSSGGGTGGSGKKKSSSSSSGESGGASGSKPRRARRASLAT